MTARTRYFVIASLLVLGVGLGTGLVAYYVGFPAGAFVRAGGPDELQLIPRDAAVVAYAGDAIQSGTALSLHGAEVAAVAAVVTGLGVHQTVNAKKPKKQ